jgi:hypothetical protein
MKQSEEKNEQRKAVNAKVKPEKYKPIRLLSEYEGEYEHPAYGLIEVKYDPGKKSLSYKYNGRSGELKHSRYDIFNTESKDLLAMNGAKIMFASGIRGEINAITIPGFEGNDAVFKRKPSAKEISPELVKKFPGEYLIENIVLKVEVDEENGLKVTIPGQPAYTLEKFKGTEYKFKGLEGFSIEFVTDKKGKNVTEAIIHQPNGLFTAVRKGAR